MSTDFRARAEKALRDRHEDKIRELADDLKKNADYILLDVERGRVPRLRNLAADAMEIAERIRALEAIDELAGIYKAASVPADTAEGDKP